MTTHPCEIDRIVPSRYDIPYEPEVKKVVTLEEILNDSFEAMGMPVSLLNYHTQIHEITICKMIYCYVARKKTGYSLTTIGRLIDRHYSTVINSRKRIEGWLDVEDEQFLSEWNRYLQNSKLFTKYDF